MADIEFPTCEELFKIDVRELIQFPPDFEISAHVDEEVLFELLEVPNSSGPTPEVYPQSENAHSYAGLGQDGNWGQDTFAPKKIFACEVCGKQYRNQRSLLNHSFKHTGVEPYSCHLCHRRFKVHSKLKEHRRLEPHCERAVKDPQQFFTQGALPQGYIQQW